MNACVTRSAENMYIREKPQSVKSNKVRKNSIFVALKHTYISEFMVVKAAIYMFYTLFFIF